MRASSARSHHCGSPASGVKVPLSAKPSDASFASATSISARGSVSGPADAEPREGIVGVICSHGGQVWFFKMKGDASLVERERAHFDAFVRSVKFDGRGGSHPGK